VSARDDIRNITVSNANGSGTASASGSLGELGCRSPSGAVAKHFGNRYLAVTHGQSVAEEQDIVVTDPAVTSVTYGLSAKGITQIEGLLSELNHALEIGCNVSNCSTTSTQITRCVTEILVSGAECMPQGARRPGALTMSSEGLC